MILTSCATASITYRGGAEMRIEWLPFLAVVLVVVPVLIGIILAERRHRDFIRRLNDISDWRERE